MISDRARRPGFALPAVLAVTGVVTLVFLVAITALASLTAEAASARGRVRFMETALTAEATIAYLAATEPLTSTGFTVGAPRSFGEFATGTTSAASAARAGEVFSVRLDGRPYATVGPHPLVLRLQDQAGMINLASLDQASQRRFMQALDVPEADFDDFIARFRDYVDTDSLILSGGAESAQYGADMPPNRPLRRPAEWLSVLGARTAVNPAAWRRLRTSLSVDTGLALNLNTMTPQALEILMDLRPDEVQSVLTAREAAPFLSIVDFTAAIGRDTFNDPELLYTFPSGRIAFEIGDTRSSWVYRGRISLTPHDLERPLWIDQTEQTEAPKRVVAQASDAVPFSYTPR